MEAKNEETEKLQSPRKLETHWVLRTLFYFLNSAISKARSTLDLSDTWSNKSSFDKLLLVEFFKTCDQESHEWSTEQHDNLLRNKKPTGTLFFLSLLLKRRSTQCFWKFKHVSQGESNLFFPFQSLWRDLPKKIIILYHILWFLWVGMTCPCSTVFRGWNLLKAYSPTGLVVDPAVG